MACKETDDLIKQQYKLVEELRGENTAYFYQLKRLII